MKSYAFHGVNDFIICCGYKGYIIKEYFNNYFLHMSDVTLHMKDNSVEVHQNNIEPWTITLIDTGEETMTGGRLKRVYDYIKDEEAFCFTYGDGVSDIDISKLINYHKSHGKLATLTAVRPPGRFGALKLTKDSFVSQFQEKPNGDGSWINGGYFVLSPKVVKDISGDQTIWEDQPLKNIAANGQLVAYKHEGFWQPMDTLREKNLLNALWDNNKASWKVW
jgi:glucose-1-phosphate cytidylyltransferase